MREDVNKTFSATFFGVVVVLYVYFFIFAKNVFKMSEQGKKKFNWVGFVIEVVKLAIAFVTGTQISNF